MKTIIKFVGFKTFNDMLKHIENNKYDHKEYEVIGHGYCTEHKHFYEVQE